MSGWVVFIYRVPTEPASGRIGVWRDLKQIGACYLQQCVCVIPDLPDPRARIERTADRIDALGGEHWLIPVPSLSDRDEARLLAQFRDQRNKEYAEIVEECETKFVKEIEFEHFRQNYTFEEAEEIGQDLEKIRRWFDRVRARDWFAASGRPDVEAWIDRCAGLLAGFEEVVYQRASTDLDTEFSQELVTPLSDPIDAAKRVEGDPNPDGSADIKKGDGHDR